MSNPTVSPALFDTFSTSINRPGWAHVVSATVDKSGKRHEYDLSYCWLPGPDGLFDRLRVCECGCIGFYTGRACRHAVGLFDALSPPLVKEYLTGPTPAEVVSAKADIECGQCSGIAFSFTLYVQRKGYILVASCPHCKREIVR